jgi:PAS domain S-box-containing protein
MVALTGVGIWDAIISQDGIAQILILGQVIVAQLISIGLCQRGLLLPASILTVGSVLLWAFGFSWQPATEAGLSAFGSYGIWLALLLAGLTLKPQHLLWMLGVTLFALVALFITGGKVNEEGNAITNSIVFMIATFSVGGIAWLVSRNLESAAQAALLSQTQRSLALQKATATVAHQLTTQLDLETLLKESVEVIRSQFDDIYHAQVFLVDKASNQARLRASTGEVGQRLLARHHALAVGSVSVIGKVTASGEAVLVSDTRNDPVHKVNELLPDTLTELALPLISSNGVIGALDVQSVKANAFSPEDIQTLQTLADQIAIAVENARLFSTAQAEAQRAKAIAEASQITSQMSLNFDKGLARLFETVTAPGNYTHWWFGVIQPDQKTLRCVTSHKSLVTSILIPYEIHLDQDRNSLVDAYRTKRAIIVNDLSSSTSFKEFTPEVVAMFGKHVATPIFETETRQVVGVLLVGRDQTAPNIENRDLELVYAVTSQLSIALQNRKLFLQVEQEQKRLRDALETMPVGVVMLDTAQKVVMANEQAQAMFGEYVKVGDVFNPQPIVYHTNSKESYRLDDMPSIQALKQGRPFSAEDLSLRHAEGGQVDILAKAAPITDERGQKAGVISIYQDISELRELERALQESLSETTKLYETSRAISHANNIPSISEAVINQLLILSPDRVYMTMRDVNDLDNPEKIELILAWPHERPAAITELGLPSALLIPPARLGTMSLNFATHQLETLPGVDAATAAQLRNSNIRTIALLPLETRNEIFGAIIVLFKEERLFAPEERRFLLTLADQTSIALDALLSFESTQKTLRSISRMYQASRAISSQTEIEDAIKAIQEQIMATEPDRILIVLSRQIDRNQELETVLEWTSDENDGTILVYTDGLYEMLSQPEYFIEDMMVSEDDNAEAYREAQSPYLALASLPFRASGQPTGRVLIGFKSPRSFTQYDRQYLQMVADSTAYVIENDLLFRQTQDSLEETGILYQAIRAFANAGDKEGILAAIIDYAADPLVDKALLCLLLTDSWQAEDAMMEVVVSWERGDSVLLKGMRFTEEQFPSWEQLSTPYILAVDDVLQDQTLDDTARMGYLALDIASFVIVPLSTAGKPIGAILLGASEARSHTEREFRIYQSLADQAAITMENIRLFEESERRARQLATSARVSQAASAILQVDDLLPEMVDLIKEAFDYDQVQIFLVNETGDRALLKASTGEAGQQLLAIQHYLEVGSRSVIGMVTSTGKPQVALDTSDARVIHKPNPYLPNTRSEMAIPLLVRQQVLGALDVQSNQPGAFTDNDVRVLTVLADQLAVAIQNASLFELAQRRSEEMSFLFTVASESTAAENLESVLQRVSELLLYQMNATLIIPYIYDEVEKSLQVGAVASLVDPQFVNVRPKVEMNHTQDVITAVAHSKMPVIIPDYNDSDYLQQRSRAMRSGIYTPLITGDHLIGVLALESDQPYQFDDNSLNLLQALTGALAAVVQSKQLLKEIQEANIRLQEIDKLKTDFLAAMSHELRTPLNSIIGFSRVILKGIDGPVTDMQRNDLQTIHDSGKHLLGLVNDILDQAKIEANKMELAREVFNLEEVIKGVMASAVGLKKEKPIRLYTELPPNFPNAFGDEFRTRQILLNLISNAIKFTEEGSVTTSAYVIYENDQPFIQVSVTDTGIGIKSEDFDKLFESFQQVDNSTTRAAEGTGLGLPLARSLAHLQGGRIWVESEFGLGSTFSVTIPVEPPAEVLEAMRAESKQQNDNDPASSPKPPKTILILDDNVELLNLYRRHLHKENYDMVGSSQLKDAKDKLMVMRPVAVVINVDMDGGQGWNYAQDIRMTPMPHHPPLITSSLQEDELRSQELGAIAHLVRPFEPDKLLKTINTLEASNTAL